MAQQYYGVATRYAVITKTDSSFFERQSLSNSIDKRLIFLCYNIPRSLIHELKQAHYTLTWFTFSLAYQLPNAYRVANY